MVNAPTQEDPVVPACSQEFEDLLQPLPVTSWAEEVENFFRKSTEEQEEGLEDPVHSPPSGESLPW